MKPAVLAAVAAVSASRPSGERVVTVDEARRAMGFSASTPDEVVAAMEDLCGEGFTYSARKGFGDPEAGRLIGVVMESRGWYAVFTGWCAA